MERLLSVKSQGSFCASLLATQVLYTVKKIYRPRPIFNRRLAFRTYLTSFSLFHHEPCASGFSFEKSIGLTFTWCLRLSKMPSPALPKKAKKSSSLANR